MDAQTYADHAGRGGKVEKEDIELAVQARAGWEFDEAPPRDVSIVRFS
jgi:transcription initiation factor TFIID subunit 9B